MKSKKQRRKNKPEVRRDALSSKKRQRANQLLDIALGEHRTGNLRQAEQSYRRVLEIDPHNARSLHHLGLIAHQAGQVRAAADLIRRAVKADPRDAACWNNLGNMCRELGEYREAIEAYRTAVERQPDYANAHYNLGLAVQKLGDARAAIQAFREVIRLTPDDADSWNRLGSAQLDDGQPAAAVESHARALEINPRSADAHNGIGLASMDGGDFEVAAQHYRKAIELDAGFTKVYLNLAKSRRFSAADRADLDLISSVLERRGLSTDERVDLHFALGKALDDCGSYDEAFEHFQAANKLRRATLTIDRAGFEGWIGSMIDTCDEAFFAHTASYGSPSVKPVFIVGMPRSGTTLVEQIISSHPAAFGAGELPTIGELSRTLREQSGTGMGYPRYLSSLDGELISQAASSYLAFLDSRSTTALRVTDKLPGNYIYLALIALMFPKAHIIDCRREPLDIVLSVYFSQFVGDHPFAYGLDDIAFEYLQYRRLLDHWDKVLPVSMYHANYEALIANPEQVSAEIVAACELPWDEQCLRFYENSRPVHTASNWQVRQPIYPRSVGRWRHYETHLTDVIASLSSIN